MEHLRDLPIDSVMGLLNLNKDACDLNQYIGQGYRISTKALKWYDHNSQKGGGGAIDLVMHVLGCDFKAARAFLSGFEHIEPVSITRESKRPDSTLPAQHNANLSTVKNYLRIVRGLDSKILDWLIRHGLLYADSKANCVFKYGSTAAELRGTGSVQWRGMRGSIEKPFILWGSSEYIAVCESAIDAISYRQLHPNNITCSIAGNANYRLIEYVINLARSKNIGIIGAFDNDKGGELAYQKTRVSASLSNIKYCENRPTKKDWNEVLLNVA